MENPSLSVIVTLFPSVATVAVFEKIDVSVVPAITFPTLSSTSASVPEFPAFAAS